MKPFLPVTAALLLFAAGTTAQSSLKMGTTGAPSGNGPVTTAEKDTLYTNGTIAFSPSIVVTYSLSNQQFPAGTVEGMSTATGMSFGATQNSSANSPLTSSAIFSAMDGLSTPTNTMFTACHACTVSTGITVSTDKAIELFNCTDALINSSNVNQHVINSRVYYGDLTITFNYPVSNPVLQVVGLGGTVSVGKSGKEYDLGYSTEFDLATTGLSLSKLSGNSELSVSSTQITNNATYAGGSSTGAALNGVTRYAATGSVVVLGNNITKIVLKVYITGDGGRVSNGTSVVTADPGLGPVWALAPSNPFGSGPLASGDAVLVGVSTQMPVTVSGNVFNDPNGANVNNSTGTTNSVPSGMYANLVDSKDSIVATVAVATDGTYSLPAIFEGTYTVSLSTTAGTQGITAPAASLPSATYANTGEFNGTPNTGNDGNINGITAAFTVASTAVTNINFAIDRLPESAVHVQTLSTNPGGTINTTILATWFTTTNSGSSPNTLDYDNGSVSHIVITGFPTHATSITINGTTYTSATFPAAGVSVPYTTGIGPTQTITVDPIDGPISVVIPFAAVDNAGKEDLTPGSVTVTYLLTLPFRLVSFTALAREAKVSVDWVVSGEADIQDYEVEAGTSGDHFVSVASIAATGATHYQVQHTPSTDGSIYYRLKSIEKDATYTYSDVVRINYTVEPSVEIYPNPVIDNIHIKSGAAIAYKPAMVSLVALDGKVIFTKHYALLLPLETLSLADLPKGEYIIRIASGNEVVNNKIVITR